MKKLLLLFLILAACPGFSQSLTTDIRLNQIGFYPHCVKTAVVAGNPAAGDFTLKSADRSTTYYTGTLGASANWSFSGETVRTADFSEFNVPGTYVIDISGIGYSHPFTIKASVFYPVTKGSMKAYYFQRSSTSLSATHAGQYARAAGHPDDAVIVHPSAATAGRPTGTTLNMPKGWYDAGDYNSYIVNSGITTYTLMAAYEHYKSYWDTLNLNIPESGNAMPDILDEIKWNLDWMLTMQDPADGGVYNKKTNAGFDGYIMPNAATTPRYVCAKGTAASLDFAAVMATAYRLYKPYDETFANTCLAAAESAWTWGINNFNVPFSNPPASNGYPAIVTGGYGDNSFYDEREWAANELYIATGSSSYYPYGFKTSSYYAVPYWGEVRILGLISLLKHRKTLGTEGIADTTSMKNKFIDVAAPLRNHQLNASAYKVAMGQGGINGNFVWGSNSAAANQAMILLVAHELTSDNSYYEAALSNLDYLLGRNATTYSFVTGFGSKTPQDPHMRLSKADGIAAPIPGWLVGGPQNLDNSDGCAYTSAYPATRYLDQMCSYSTNEIAINWNAPFVFTASGIETLHPCQEQFPTGIFTGESAPALRLFPNPASQTVKVQLPEHAASSLLTVYNAQGDKVYERMVPAMIPTVELDVQTYSSGLYHITFKQDQTIYAVKLVKQ